jgi:hypothetical protein
VFASAKPDSEIWLSSLEETASDGSTLSTISNQGTSGTTGDATAVSGDATFNSSGGVQNNQPYYNIDTAKFEFNISTTGPSGFAIYLVYSNKNDPPADGEGNQFNFSSSADSHMPFNDGNFYIASGDTSRYISGVDGESTAGTNVVKITGDGSGIVAEQNTGGSTSTLGTSSTINYTFQDPVIIGKVDEIAIEMYELIFYTEYPSSSERQNTEGYINGNYNTSL